MPRWLVRTPECWLTVEGLSVRGILGTSSLPGQCALGVVSGNRLLESLRGGVAHSPFPASALALPILHQPGAPSCSCFFRCRSRLVCCPKQRLHRWHLNGFSLLWMFLTCRWRLEEMLNDRSQYLHLENRCTLPQRRGDHVWPDRAQTSVSTAVVAIVEPLRPPGYPAGEFRCIPGWLSLETSMPCLNCPS